MTDQEMVEKANKIAAEENVSFAQAVKKVMREAPEQTSVQKYSDLVQSKIKMLGRDLNEHEVSALRMHAFGAEAKPVENFEDKLSEKAKLISKEKGITFGQAMKEVMKGYQSKDVSGTPVKNSFVRSVESNQNFIKINFGKPEST